MLEFFRPNSALLLLIWADNSAQNRRSVLIGGSPLQSWALSVFGIF